MKNKKENINGEEHTETRPIGRWQVEIEQGKSQGLFSRSTSVRLILVDKDFDSGLGGWKNCGRIFLLAGTVSGVLLSSSAGRENQRMKENSFRGENRKPKCS